MAANNTIRVLIADDHAAVREGLRVLLSSEPGLELVGEAADGAEAVVQAQSLRPDVILMDLAMPRKSGLEAIGEIRRENPQARILVLTGLAEGEVQLALQAGALGYLPKGALPQQLLGAIQKAYSQEWLTPM
jgi:NarL family two-component system response regulator LiaR